MMSFEEEIIRKKQNMKEAIDEEARRREEKKRLEDARKAAGMREKAPILRMPSQALQTVISEAMPSMSFKSPKIIRSLPDGTTRVRTARDGERADDYSFDLIIASFEGDKNRDPHRSEIWFFKNGSVAFMYNDDDYFLYRYHGGVYDMNTYEKNEVAVSRVREKIIEAIAAEQMKSDSSSNNSSNSSGGCYIATAVYGSYDCPEVWTLRRYRDYTLKSTLHGRLFTKIYYVLSPSLVRVFGNNILFQRFCKKRLDYIVDNLQRKGFSDEPYVDAK